MIDLWNYCEDWLDRLLTPTIEMEILVDVGGRTMEFGEEPRINKLCNIKLIFPVVK